MIKQLSENEEVRRRDSMIRPKGPWVGLKFRPLQFGLHPHGALQTDEDLNFRFLKLQCHR